MTTTSSGSSRPTTYYPAVDGLRAIAVLTVFCAHYLSPFPSVSKAASWGWSGVDVFFVLSGFLITGILFDTRDRGNFFGSFYVRRALRIFPLYYGVWAVIFILGLLGHPAYNRYNFAVPLYLENFFGVTHPQGCAIQIAFARRTLFLAVGHFWSLALEEQFYLLWPVTVWLVRDRRRLSQLCTGTCVFVLLLRSFLRFHLPASLAGSDFLYNQFYTRVDSLLIGGWLSLYVRRPDITPTQIARLGNWLFPAALALFAAGEWITSRFRPVGAGDPFCASVGFTLIDLAAGGLLLLTISPGSYPYRALAQRPLISLGRISYGFYVFHALPLYYLVVHEVSLRSRHLDWIIPIIALGYSIGAAWLSYRYWEMPFLRLKDRLSSARTLPPHPSGEPYPTNP